MSRPGSLESKIQDAHKNYLVAELVVERSQKSEWRKYAEFLRLRVKENGPMLNADQVCSPLGNCLAVHSRICSQLPTVREN